MPIVPWEHAWTERAGRPILQGSDFIDTVEFPIKGGLAVNWTGMAVRGQLRPAYGSSAEPLASIACTIIDPHRRIVRFAIPAAVTELIANAKGRWDAELYRFDAEGTVTFVQRFVSGPWDLSREVTT